MYGLHVRARTPKIGHNSCFEKQDLKSAINPVEMTEKLGLHSNCNCDLNNDRNWYVQKSCATTGDGLYSGMQKLQSK